MYKRENDFDDTIFTYAQRYNVPAWVIKATIGKESSFDPSAYRPEPVINDASRGLMQLLAETARALGLKGATGNDTTRTDGLYEPELNIQLGAKLLAQLRSRYPSEPWDAIYSAYNAGSIQREASGLFENEAHVVGWRRNADYFNPGWRGPTESAGPFPPAPATGRKPAP